MLTDMFRHCNVSLFVYSFGWSHMMFRHYSSLINRCLLTCLLTHRCSPLWLVQDCLQQSSPKIQNSFVIWLALQLKGSIPIFSLFQQQDLKDNTLYKWVSKREDTQIWVMPLLILKMDLLYEYSVGGYRYCVENLFWIWVPKWVLGLV